MYTYILSTSANAQKQIEYLETCFELISNLYTKITNTSNEV